METLRLRAWEPADLERAAALLRQGKLVAFPTETVYGLGGLGLDAQVVRRIYEAKGRPAGNPLILHVDSLEAARPLWSRESPAAAVAADRCEAAARAFWPGPLTLVAFRSALVPPEAAAGLDTVAVRCPANETAHRLLVRVGEPVAAPSANASGRVSPTTAADVLESLDGRIDAVLDGGPTSVGIESTVIDLTTEPPTILRPGSLTEDTLHAVFPGTASAAAAPGTGPARSPGLLGRHYAPRIARRQLGNEEDLTRAWSTRAAILLRRATHDRLDARLGPRPEGAPHEVLDDDPVPFARGLYAALYRIERAAPEELLVERPPEEPAAAWRAVLDRLTRATA